MPSWEVELRASPLNSTGATRSKQDDRSSPNAFRGSNTGFPANSNSNINSLSNATQPSAASSASPPGTGRSHWSFSTPRDALNGGNAWGTGERGWRPAESAWNVTPISLNNAKERAAAAAAASSSSSNDGSNNNTGNNAGGATSGTPMSTKTATFATEATMTPLTSSTAATAKTIHWQAPGLTPKLEIPPFIQDSRKGGWYSKSHGPNGGSNNNSNNINNSSSSSLKKYLEKKRAEANGSSTIGAGSSAIALAGAEEQRPMGEILQNVHEEENFRDEKSSIGKTRNNNNNNNNEPADEDRLKIENDDENDNMDEDNNYNDGEFNSQEKKKKDGSMLLFSAPRHHYRHRVHVDKNGNATTLGNGEINTNNSNTEEEEVGIQRQTQVAEPSGNNNNSNNNHYSDDQAKTSLLLRTSFSSKGSSDSLARRIAEKNDEKTPRGGSERIVLNAFKEPDDRDRERGGGGGGYLSNGSSGRSSGAAAGAVKRGERKPPISAPLAEKRRKNLQLEILAPDKKAIDNNNPQSGTSTASQERSNINSAGSGESSGQNRFWTRKGTSPRPSSTSATAGAEITGRSNDSSSNIMRSTISPPISAGTFLPSSPSPLGLTARSNLSSDLERDRNVLNNDNKMINNNNNAMSDEDNIDAAMRKQSLWGKMQTMELMTSSQSLEEQLKHIGNMVVASTTVNGEAIPKSSSSSPKSGEDLKDQDKKRPVIINTNSNQSSIGKFSSSPSRDGGNSTPFCFPSPRPPISPPANTAAFGGQYFPPPSPNVASGGMRHFPASPSSASSSSSKKAGKDGEEKAAATPQQLSGWGGEGGIGAWVEAALVEKAGSAQSSSNSIAALQVVVRTGDETTRDGVVVLKRLDVNSSGGSELGDDLAVKLLRLDVTKGVESHAPAAAMLDVSSSSAEFGGNGPSPRQIPSPVVQWNKVSTMWTERLGQRKQLDGKTEGGIVWENIDDGPTVVDAENPTTATNRKDKRFGGGGGTTKQPTIADVNPLSYVPKETVATFATVMARVDKNFAASPVADICDHTEDGHKKLSLWKSPASAFSPINNNNDNTNDGDDSNNNNNKRSGRKTPVMKKDVRPVAATKEALQREQLSAAIARGDVAAACAAAEALAKDKVSVDVVCREKREAVELWQLVRTRMKEGRIGTRERFRRSRLLLAIEAAARKNRRKQGARMLETLDFDSAVEMQKIRDMKSTPLGKFGLLVFRGVMTLLLGVIVGLVAFCIVESTHAGLKAKLSAVKHEFSADRPWGGYLVMIAISVACAVLGAILVEGFAKEAAGSGVSYVLGYLNGTHLTAYLSWKVLVVKIVGLILCIISGLPLGMEAALCHIAGLIAMGLTRAGAHAAQSLRWSTVADIFRNHSETRLFIACGVAAGLSSAFKAPIAGTLIALEASSSFLTCNLITRLLACASMCSFMLIVVEERFFERVDSSEPTYGNKSIVFEHYDTGEFIVWFFLAIACGVIGAFASQINFFLYKHVYHRLQHRFKLGVIVTGCLTAIVSAVFLAAATYPRCIEPDEVSSLCNPSDPDYAEICPSFSCKNGLISEMSILMLNSPEEVMEVLFSCSHQHAQLSPPVLVTHAVLILVTSTFVYGVPLPGGLFVPTILVGGGFGRAVGVGMSVLFEDDVACSGMYALIAACASLSAFSRMTVPIVLLLVEYTGRTGFLLPMVMASIMGRLTAGLIARPLYDQQMRFKKFYSIGDYLPSCLKGKEAKDIMRAVSAEFAPLSVQEEICVLLSVLEDGDGFRIVYDKAGNFLGTISKAALLRLCFVLQSHLASRPPPAPGVSLLLNPPVATAGEIPHGIMPELPDGWDRVGVKVDLRQFVDRHVSPVFADTSLVKVHALFRRLGVSHVVVMQGGEAIGVVTRHDLLKPRD